MYRIFFILISIVLYSNAIPIMENIPSESQQIPKSFNEAMFSDQYIRDAPALYKNEPYACPNLTKPDCDVKTTTNTMMQPCRVCVAREGESCDPYLDPCESGTVCLPVNMDGIGVNVCTRVSLEEWDLMMELSKIDTRIFEEKPATNLQQIRKQRRRKSKCGKKFGRKCLRRQQKNKKMLKVDRLPNKFTKSKNPCKAHRRYLKKRKTIKAWKPHCTKDGFYSTKEKMCLKSKSWCVNRNGFFVRKASKKTQC